MRFISYSLLLAALVMSGCSKTTPPARAFKIQNRTELIGGKRALAEVGDFKISNGLVHAIIQDVGTSRGFGAFGGSLIDVDLVRGGEAHAATGAVGNDYFTEMFPAFFLTAIEPSEVVVLNDGSDGNAASIQVRGHSGSFVSVVKSITSLVDPKGPLDYRCTYSLAPGERFIRIEVSVTNPSQTTDASWLLDVPFGFVTLMGEGQRLFVPGKAGFDMRYHLEDVYKQASALDALPGVVAPMWTSEGDGVSYALAAARPLSGNYVDGKPMYYPEGKPDSLVIPIASSSFLASFWAKAPRTLPPQSTFNYAGYLAVGSGDVTSAAKIIYDIEDKEIRPNGNEFIRRAKTPYGTLSGLVTEAKTNLPMAAVSVVLQDEAGNYVSQAQTLNNGRWTAVVPPGTYIAYAVDSTRALAKTEQPVTIAQGETANINLQMEEPGMLMAIIRDETGRALPAKISVEARTTGETGFPRNHLYNLKVGERYRQSDFVPDVAGDQGTQKYLERFAFAADGRAGIPLRRGHYTVYASRGVEYSLEHQEVDIAPGKTTTVAFTVTHVAKTPGWLSGDFHVHSVKSVDSNMSLEERVKSYAAEGVDFLSSTDHNYVADLSPTIESLNLSDWVHSVVGLELTSLEMGHFNAFPLKLDPGPVGHGSFRWFFRPPGELFAQLRGLGTDPQNTIVQVNHPRDTILGYFNAFNMGTFTGLPTRPTGLAPLDSSPQADGTPSPYDPKNFSLDFDAIEVFNGKRYDSLFSYRVPTTPLEGTEPNLPQCSSGLPTKAQDCLPKPGEVIMRATETTVGPTRSLLQPAFPGVMDDWFTLLAQGHRFTATGNSDSHGPTAEAGLPRTYLEVGETADGSMRGLDEAAPIRALHEARAFVTNGPLLEVTLNGQGIGRTVVAPDGKVTLHIVVRAAPWVDVKRVTVRRGDKAQTTFATELEVIPVPAPTAGSVLRLDVTKTYEGTPDDAFFVVDAKGDESMWPVFTPYEVGSIQISDAVAVIGGSFGFGSKFGKYEPKQEQIVYPYAFTNPIWVTRSNKQGLRAVKRVLPVSSSEKFTPRQLPDLRRLFGAFHADPE